MDPPLEGYRIIDLGQIYNRPYCSLLLALLGAEVIKVRKGEGFQTRFSSPRADTGQPMMSTASRVPRASRKALSARRRGCSKRTLA